MAFSFTLKEEPVNEGIKWMEFNEGYALANKTGKIAIIDCYTDWCGWCKVMDKKTFTDSGIIEKLNENFIAIKFNPEEKDKYYIVEGDTVSGPELLYGMSNNNPQGYPTMFYYVPQNRKMFQQPGYKTAEQLNKILDDFIDYQKKLKN